MTDLSPVISAAVTLIAALITAFVIPWIKRRTTAHDREELLKWVEIAVAAAEQLCNANKVADKKQYVLKFLEEKGFRLSPSEIDNAVEAAVLRLHHELGAAS